MSRTSKSSLEKENRVKTVRDSGRSSKRRHSPTTESDRSSKKAKVTSLSKDNKRADKKHSKEKSPSKHDKYESSSRRRHEKHSDRKERKHTPSPTNLKTGSTPSNSTKSSEARGHSKERSSGRRHEKHSDRKTSRRRDTSPGTSQSEKAVKYSQEVTTMVELMPAVVTRQVLADLLYTPSFNSIIIGCYVRLLGQADGIQDKYFIWRIVDVKELDVSYEINEKPTNKYIMCQKGSEERLFRMKFASSSNILPLEFVDWLLCTQSSGNLPTLGMIEEKKAAIQKAMHHSYNTAEIEMIGETKKKLRNGPLNIAMNKADLFKRMQLAHQTGDLEDALRIQMEINELDGAVGKQDMERSTASNMATIINQRNRAQMMNRVLAEPVTLKEDSENDPFSRKRGHTRLVTGTKSKGQENIAPSTENVSEIAKLPASEPIIPLVKTSKPQEETMSSLHDVELDFDIGKLTKFHSTTGIDIDDEGVKHIPL